MTSFFGELRRRNVVKVAVAYAIVGWVLVEIAATVFPVFQMPEWTVVFVTMLLILGFPIALILSWAYEITPEGMKRSHEVPAPESITHVTGRKIDFAIIGALVLALGFVVYSYVLEDGPNDAPEVAFAESEPGVLPNSIAVLPLANLSPDPNDAYFADGLHEEILNRLAAIRGLSVIARTSVLQYAEAPPPIPEIASALRVQVVMEGSVRRSGDRILVTAQLIEGTTGAHLWTETYDRDLEDIFEIQGDIATRIAQELRVELSTDEEQRLARRTTNSFEAYAAYLRAPRASGPFNSSAGVARFHALMDEAIRLDPEFAYAYARKADRYAVSLISPTLALADPAALAQQEARVQEYAEKALEIDPFLGLAYSALATVHSLYGRITEARRDYERAYRLSPNDPTLLQRYATFLSARGEHTEAVQLTQRAVELNPNFPGLRHRLGWMLFAAGDVDAALTAYQRSLDMNPRQPQPSFGIGVIEVIRGNDAEALRALRIAEEFSKRGGFTSPGRLAGIAYMYSRLTYPTEAERLFLELQDMADELRIGESSWAMAYMALGDYEEALNRLQSLANSARPDEGSNVLQAMNLLANRWNDPILEEPEFVEVLERLGFTDL